MFLRYLYSGEVELTGNDVVYDLLAVADKYDVEPLMEVCVQHMAKNTSVENVVDVMTLAHRHSLLTRVAYPLVCFQREMVVHRNYGRFLWFPARNF